MSAITSRPKPKSASVMVLDSLGRVLLCPWKRDPLKFSLPGGKGEAGEDHRAIAVREFFEETGFRLNLLCLVPVVHDPFDSRDYVGFVSTEGARIEHFIFEPAPRARPRLSGRPKDPG